MLEFKLKDGTLMIAEIQPCQDDDGSLFPTLSNLCPFDDVQLSAEQMIEAESIAWSLIDKMD